MRITRRIAGRIFIFTLFLRFVMTATIKSTAQTFDAGRSLPPATLDSLDLLRGQKSVTIQHNGVTYRLQATKLGKLILTK